MRLVGDHTWEYFLQMIPNAIWGSAKGLDIQEGELRGIIIRT